MFNVARTLRTAAARFVARALDAAGGGRRYAGLKPTANLNNELLAGAATIAARASSLYHNDAHIRAAVDALVAHLVGCGFIPTPKHPDERVRKSLVTLWKNFVRVADPAGRMDLDGLAKLAALSMIRDGECFVVFHLSDDPAMPLRVELIHRDQLPLDRFAELIPNGIPGHRIRAGIEFDGGNRPAAYHFLTARPGDMTAPFDGAGWETIRVPAEQVLHVFNAVEIGQIRGLSWITPAVLTATTLNAYRDAALEKAKVAALMVGFVRDPSGEALGLPGSLDNGVLTAGMEPGALIPLPTGADITMANPPQNTDFEPFVRAQLRSIASATGCTYEQVSGDLSGTSFSSARVGLLEFRRKMEPLQFQFAHQFYDPIFRRLVTLAALSGTLDAPDFFADPEAYLSVDWLPPKWDYVNPAQEVKAEVDAIAAGLKSRAQAVAERGYDVAAVDAERASDHARETTLGLSPANAKGANAVRVPMPTDDRGEPLAATLNTAAMGAPGHA